MKTVYCHLMGPYKRDGQYPEIKESIAIDSLIAYIGEFVQIGQSPPAKARGLNREDQE